MKLRNHLKETTTASADIPSLQDEIVYLFAMLSHSAMSHPPNAQESVTTTTTMSSNIVSRSSAASGSSAEQIRSKFLRRIGIDSSPPDKPIKRSLSHSSTSSRSDGSMAVPRSCTVGECILRLEPLKIALESDDDSSVDSFDDSSSACEMKDDLNTQDSFQQGYYHKKPHCAESALPTSSRQDVNVSIEESSGHSLPSLVGSDTSSVSGCFSNRLSCSASSNKKARYLNGRPRNKKKSVSINKSVSVVSIPSRGEYSDRLRERIWATGAEIQASAARNTLEFCSENWDLANVLEDEHMFVHQANGERVHPIHVHNAMAHIRACEEDPVNEEEIQLNLRLISCLLPPVAAVNVHVGGTKEKASSEKQPLVGHASSFSAAA